MNQNEPLHSLIQNFTWAISFAATRSVIALTPGLWLFSQKEAVWAMDIPETIDRDSLPITIAEQRLPSQLLPKFTVTQLPNPIPPRTPQPPLEDSQPTPQPPVELKPSPVPSTTCIVTTAPSWTKV